MDSSSSTSSFSSDKRSENAEESSECDTVYTLDESNGNSSGYEEYSNENSDYDSEGWEETSDEESISEVESNHTSVYGDEYLLEDQFQAVDCDSDDGDGIGFHLGDRLMTSIRWQRQASVLNHVEDGAGVSCQMDNNVPPLHYAVKFSNHTVVSALLRAGLDPNLIHEDRSPLLLAVVRNKPDIASALLDAGAYVNFRYQKSTRKRTLLHRAVLHNFSGPLIQLLLDHGADINAKDHLGESVLCCAAKNKSIGTYVKTDQIEYVNRLEFLIFRGAEMFKDGPGGEDDAFEAVLQYGPVEAVHLFLNGKVKLDNFRDRPLLHIAVLNPYKRVISFLLDSRVFDIEMRNSVGHTVLHEVMSISVCHPSLELLLRYGANPNSLDGFDQPPILTALLDKKFGEKTVQQLLDFGACVDIKILQLIGLNRDKCDSSCVKYIIAHLVLFKGQDRDVDLCVRRLVDIFGLQYFYNACKQEVISLKNLILFSELTYYNFLVSKNGYRIVDNQLVKDAFENPKLVVSRFPVYGKRMNRHFSRSQEKLQAMNSLNRLIGYDTDAFHLIYHKILHYLRQVDLQNLIAV